MLFDWYSYMMNLIRDDENEKLQTLIQEYIDEVEGSIYIKNYKDLYIYKNYMNQFPTFKFLPPKSLQDKFPWDLLLQLVLSSFSCLKHVKYNHDKKLPELLITVTNESVVTKKLSELNALQIFGLFDIYFREQIELELIIRNDKGRKKEIITQRKNNLIAAQRIQLMVNKYNFLYK